jgi:hypothetical protein
MSKIKQKKISKKELALRIIKEIGRLEGQHDVTINGVTGQLIIDANSLIEFLQYILDNL